MLYGSGSGCDLEMGILILHKGVVTSQSGRGHFDASIDDNASRAKRVRDERLGLEDDLGYSTRILSGCGQVSRMTIRLFLRKIRQSSRANQFRRTLSIITRRAHTNTIW